MVFVLFMLVLMTAIVNLWYYEPCIVICCFSEKHKKVELQYWAYQQWYDYAGHKVTTRTRASKTLFKI